MSQVKSKNTKPEILVRKFLYSKGFRYRTNDKNLPGKPDIVLRKYKTVIFVNGCFWHGHKNCQASKLPNTRKEFWRKKIEGNSTRDKKNIASLKQLGWKALTIWQCQLRKQNNRKIILERVCQKLLAYARIMHN